MPPSLRTSLTSIKNTGTRFFFLFTPPVSVPNSPSSRWRPRELSSLPTHPSLSETQTKHFIPGSVAKTERVSPAFSRCVRTISRARKRRREGCTEERKKRSLSGFSPWLNASKTTDVPPSSSFFSLRSFRARHAKKFFLSRRCQNRTRRSYLSRKRRRRRGFRSLLFPSLRLLLPLLTAPRPEISIV